MLRFAPLLPLVLLPGTALADAAVPVPGVRSIWIDYVFIVEQDYPDYEFFLLSRVDGAKPERLPLSRSSPVRVSGPGDDHRYKWAYVYAVRKELLRPFQSSLPPGDWLARYRGDGVQRLHASDQAGLDFRKAAWFYDSRDRGEIVYRVEMSPDGGRLVKVSENAGSPWVKRGWQVAGVTAMLGVAGLGLWLLRRHRHVSTP